MADPAGAPVAFDADAVSGIFRREYGRTVATLVRVLGDIDLAEEAVQLAHAVDVVCMWDTIEHLQHPHLYIERASANMNRGGVIAITTGDIGSLMARMRGAETWVVGIRPDVAVAMVRLGMDMGRIRTALDLDEGLEQLGVSPR